MVLATVTRKKTICLRSDIAMLRMMVRGDCLPVMGSASMSWKYDDEQCVCCDLKSEAHVLFYCNLSMDGRIRRNERWMLSMLMCMIL